MEDKKYKKCVFIKFLKYSVASPSEKQKKRYPEKHVYYSVDRR